MPVQALIFDVDGTLADTEELHRQAFNQAFCALGLDWNWDTALYGELLRVTGGKERIASYIDRLRRSASERDRLQRLVPELHAVKSRRYRELIELGQARPRAGVLRLMREARQAGVRLAIASTTSPENIEPLIRSGFGSDAMSWFGTIATGDVVPAKKPAPDIYNFALTALRVAPGRAIAIEDSAIGVQSAKAAGLFTLATPSIWTREQDFSTADLVLGSLGDPDEPLAAADQSRLGAQYLVLKGLVALHAASHFEGIAHGKAS